ncbi:hypothetical protein B0H16DRAFT_1455955 [Mycena metata]|uniref:MYND-type domain-containing protein n=1 Tax=Mycena metata TaxID=1033252 RepID=A0AAD7JG02_9AGAR|nr:hypothetical protein B0H16DRAFT_1455955 [Mycena metata]
MDDSLRLSALSALPATTRNIATAAAGGSLPELVSVWRTLQGPNFPSRQKRLLLPVVYENLDVRGIPVAGDLDAAEAAPGVRMSVIRALVARECVHGIPDIPTNALSALWPRYWSWADFLHTYSAYVPWLVGPTHSDLFVGPTDAHIAARLVLFIDPFRLASPKRFSEIFPATPGFRAMVVRSWVTTLRTDDLEMKEYCQRISWTALRQLELCSAWDLSDPHNLEEIIEGAGGTINDLASLIVDHTEWVLAHVPTTSEHLVDYLYGVFTLISEIETRANPVEQKSSTVLAPLSASVLRLGIIRPAAIALLLSVRHRNPDLLPTIDRCVLVVGRLLSSAEGFQHLPEAINAGFLDAILLCVAQFPVLDAQMEVILTHILPASTVYYHMLGTMELALQQVQSLERSAKFRRSKIYGAWEEFKDLVTERLRVRDIFNAGEEYTLRKACDNLDCGRIERRGQFARCSDCNAAYYCSKECQKQDWKYGGHRESCSWYRSSYLSQHTPLDIRERDFLRALLYYDSRGIRYHIQQVLFMHEHPDTPYYTVWNYFRGSHVHVSGIHDVEQLPEGLTGDPQWVAHVGRAFKSDGRVDIHIVIISQGDVARFWIVPLRADRNDIHDGLSRIAASLPSRALGPGDIMGLSAEILGLTLSRGVVIF